MFKTIVAGYLHRKLIKVCWHYYFDVMTNIKRQDKYYWISTSQDNKSCQHFYDVMTNFKHQKEKSLGHRHHRKHIPNSGFFKKSSSLIMDWFGKQSIFTMVSFQGIQSLAKNTCQEIKNGIFFSTTSNSNQRTYYRYVFLQSIWNPYRIFSSNHEERCSRNTFRKSIFGLWLIRSMLIFSLQ